MRTILLLALLLLTGCYGGQPTTVYVEDSELDAVTQASVDRLNAAAGVDLVITDDPDADITIVSATRCPSGSATLGCNIYREVRGHRITDFRIRIIAPREYVVIHELGHALRGRHGHAKHGIFADPIEHDYIDSADLRYLCSVVECAWQTPEL